MVAEVGGPLRKAHARVALLLRRARKVENISYREVASWEDLLQAREPAILWLHEPATLQPPDPFLFDELANDEIRAEHFRVAPQAVGIGIACMRDVLVSNSSLVGTASTLYRLGPLAPLYVDQLLSEDILSNALPVGDRRLRRKNRRDAPDACILLTHWNSPVYGHWLLESLPKLLFLHRIRSRLPALRIALPLSTPAWARQWIDLVLPGAPIENYNDRREYLRCEMLLAPTLLMHPEHFFHPELHVLLEELIARTAPRTPDAGERLYVSRLGLSKYRRLINAQEIEEIAADEGLRIVKPETMSIEEQVALFASASIIVGEFGSGMHNTIFSPACARVLCLNWINAMQSRIAQLRRQRVGYLLPDDGAPVLFSSGAPARTYHIDPKTFRTYLRMLIA